MTTFITLKSEDKKTIHLDKPGKYVAFMHNVSGEFTFDIKSKNVDLDIFGLYVGRGDDIFKIHTIQNHDAPSSTSNLYIKGVFYDNSKFHYQGLIKIEKKGQKSHAYQKNKNLMLSPHAFVESEPFLEILANDVFCTHGSTTGKLNEEEMYYLKSRGIEQKKAEGLLVQGFINEITEIVREYDSGIKFLT